VDGADESAVVATEGDLTEADTTDAPPSGEPAAPPQDAPEDGAPASPTWTPTFDRSDDLGGLLAPRGKLLRRAFGAEPPR
jgi:hypothetical protein